MKRSGYIQRKTPLKRTGYRIRPMSKKRQAESRIYTKNRKAFLEAHPFCQVWLKEHGLDEDVCVSLYEDGITFYGREVPRSIEIHHREKRGKNYLNESTWLAVCREMHDKIENNKSWARAKGYLV